MFDTVVDDEAQAQWRRDEPRKPASVEGNFSELCFFDARFRLREMYEMLSPASDILDEVAGCAVNCARHALQYDVEAILDHLANFAGLSPLELASKGDAQRETRRSLFLREMRQARRRVVELGQAPPPLHLLTAREVNAEAVASNGPLRCGWSLSEMTRPPGLVGDLVDWIEASGEYPSRELGLGAALGWVATLGGRGYETPSRARTNLYMVALAPSGFGKDHAGSCIMSLAQTAGLDRFIGPARFMSASGMRESLMSQPSLFAIQDEFGGIIRQIDGPKVGIHNEMIRVDLLAMFSRAKDLYAGVSYAQTKAIKLFNPNLSLYGMSTPDDFWSALSSARTADGFLPRFLLFNVEGRKPERVTPALSAGSPPKSLVEASRAIIQAVSGNGNLGGVLDGTFAQAARKVPLNAEAVGELAELEDWIKAAEGRVDSRQEPILNRTREHALKLALTIAIGVDPVNPTITGEAMRWGCRMAWLSTCRLAGEIDRHVADNDRQRDFKRLVEIIRREGVEGITRSMLLRKLGATIDTRKRDELIEEAKDMGQIEMRIHQPKTGRPSGRYFVC